MDKENILEVKDLHVDIRLSEGLLTAVRGVNFEMKKGETLGLVGESGGGKTTVGRTLLHLYKPTAGEIWFDGKKIETKKDILWFHFRQKSLFFHK